MFCVRRWRLSGTGFTPLRCRFFRDFVVATDIRSADSRTMRITISLDQTHFAGPVIGSETSGTWDGLPWVHHDGRGYVSLDGAPVMVGTDVQKGTWDRIDPFYKDKTQQGRVFKCWFEHDPSRTDGYAYAFLPCRDAKHTERFACNPTVRILRNDAGCQAVEYGKTVCAVVRRAGKYALVGRTISAGEPALYIISHGRTQVRKLPPVSNPAD